MSSFVEVLNALLTPIIAIIAVYIAWQQHKTSHQTLNLARYDRRMCIYAEVKAFLGKIIANADISFEEISEFQRNVADADFLFGREIASYLHEIVTHANVLRVANSQYCDDTMIKPEGYNHSEVVEREHKELMWLVTAWDNSREKFRKDLSIGDDGSVHFFDLILNLFRRR